MGSGRRPSLLFVVDVLLGPPLSVAFLEDVPDLAN